MRVTGYEAQGSMGRVKTVASPVFFFPPSFARKFSSRERRLGTRQYMYMYGIPIRVRNCNFR